MIDPEERESPQQKSTRWQPDIPPNQMAQPILFPWLPAMDGYSIAGIQTCNL